MTTRVKNLAHDKAFANVYSLDTDISRLKQEIKDNITPFITIEQLQGVLDHTKRQREVWNYIATLIEKDHERIDYLDYEKQNEIT
jgi:glutamine cyclotransferase